MNNQIALSLAALIAALLLLDLFWLHLDLPVRAGKQLDQMVEYLSFWR